MRSRVSSAVALRLPFTDVSAISVEGLAASTSATGSSSSEMFDITLLTEHTETRRQAKLSVSSPASRMSSRTYKIQTVALTDGLRFCTTAQMARIKTMAPMIHMLQAITLAAEAKPSTHGEMNTHAPKTILIQLIAAGALAKSAQRATSTIRTPKIHASQELFILLHVTEYHGAIKSITPKIRLTQLCHRDFLSLNIIIWPPCHGTLSPGRMSSTYVSLHVFD